MQSIFAGNLVESLESFGRFQSDFELELIAMFSTFLDHSNTSTGVFGL